MHIEHSLSVTGQFMVPTRDVSDDERLRGLEATVRRRDDILAAISHAAARFIDASEWEADIADVVGRIGRATEATRAYVFEGYHDDANVLRARTTHEWRAVGAAGCDPAQGTGDVEVAALGVNHSDAVRRGDVVRARAPRLERSHIDPGGTCSTAAVPIFAGAEWWGYLCVADEIGTREWSGSAIEALRAVAAMIGAAVYRNRAEEELRESEERFRRLSDAAFEGVFIHERGNLIEANAAIGRMFGYELEELEGKNLIELVVAPESRERVYEHMQQGSEARYEVTGVRRDGSPLIAEITGRSTSYRGRPARVVTINDVTERVEAAARAAAATKLLADEQAARVVAEAGERRAAFLAEASRVLGTSFDYRTTLAALTRLAVPALGDFCTVDLIGRDGNVERVGVAHVDPVREPLLWEGARWLAAGAPMVHHLKKALVDGKPVLIPVITDRMLAANSLDEAHGQLIQKIRPYSLLTVPLRASGRVVGALALYSATPERRLGADDLALAEELAGRAALAVDNARLFHEAELATRTRDHMLGVVAHDLRNPLGTITMASELIEDTLPPDAPQRRQIAMVVRASERMNRLIQDLLDVKRMENGRLTVEPVPVAAAALMHEAVEMLRLPASASAVELVLDAPEALPPVLADPIRVQQVLSNLIGNAIKFTPRGGRITLRGCPSQDAVLLAVSDTGPGISPEQLPHIFGQFWQGARTDQRGIGLGLAIAKGIVEAHHGRIWVESTVGAGSSFFFTLPRGDGAPGATLPA